MQLVSCSTSHGTYSAQRERLPAQGDLLLTLAVESSTEKTAEGQRDDLKERDGLGLHTHTSLQIERFKLSLSA
jgi:hypothetical protein